MPQYISLINYTSQGVAAIKDSPDRLAAAKSAIESAGGKMLSYHLTLGQYDAVTLTEFPNDEAATTVLLTLGMQGNLSTQTMRAFTEEEFSGLLNNLP
jgi:uncharacterized protein with GYD domain